MKSNKGEQIITCILGMFSKLNGIVVYDKKGEMLIVLTCNEANAKNLSRICADEQFNEDYCIHNFDEQWPWRIGLGVWGLIVLLFGGFGNLFTIVSLPYAARKQR